MWANRMWHSELPQSTDRNSKDTACASFLFFCMAPQPKYATYNGMQLIGIDVQIIRHIDITFISDWLFKQLNLTLLYVLIYWKIGHYLKKPRPENIRKKVNLVLNIPCKAIRLFKHGNTFSKPDVFLSLSSCSERCLELLVPMATFTLTIPYCSGFQSGPAWGPTALHIS